VGIKIELTMERDFLQEIAHYIYSFLSLHISNSNLLWFLQFASKILIFLGFFFLVDFTVQILLKIMKSFLRKGKNAIMHALYNTKIPNSVSHIVTLWLCEIALSSIFYESHKITQEVLGKIVDIIQVIVVGGAALRIYKFVEIQFLKYQEDYKLVALKVVSQTIKVVGSIFLFFIGIKIIFNINMGAILGSLSAMMAVMMLVFKDSILGIVTSIYVSISKSLKEGDLIEIPKYKIKGNLLNISLITTKIKNLDDTISTIPTYDLLTTEVKNYDAVDIVKV